MMEKNFRSKSCFQVARTYLFLLLTVLAATASSYAQNVVKGVVVDVADYPLPGVSVVVKGSSVGTTTDLDGRYSIMCLKMEHLYSLTLVWPNRK